MSDKPWYAPRSPDEIISVPWLHADAVDYMDTLLQPDWRVLEHGGGGSTLWFAELVKDVVTIEHDLYWRLKLRDIAPGNVTLLERVPENAPEEGFDLFMIDGEREMRGSCIIRARLYVRPGGWVVLDNANRPEYEAERRTLFDWCKLKARFDNNIPRSKYFVTEFWQCGLAPTP